MDISNWQEKEIDELISFATVNLHKQITKLYCQWQILQNTPDRNNYQNQYKENIEFQLQKLLFPDSIKYLDYFS